MEITFNEYNEAKKVVAQYENKNTPKYAILVKINDTHHDYNYLKIGHIYKIDKFIHTRQMSDNYFELIINNKRRKYKQFSPCLDWDFEY